MQKNKMMRTASVLLVAVLLSTCAISGTFAKYVTDQTVTATATVAKWSVKIDNTDITVTGSNPTVTFELFDTACDLATNGNVTTTEDADIKTDGQIIAPGSGGKGDFVITNESQVKAKYSIVFSVNAAGVPLEFSTDNNIWKSADEIATLNTNDNLAMENGTATITLYWRWVFTDTNDGNRNQSDTTLGIAGTASPTVTATVTVEQVD